jgi:CspA family cold shock protein
LDSFSLMTAAKTCFLHATALERAGIRNLVEGQKVSFDTEPDRRTGKAAATDLRAD